MEITQVVLTPSVNPLKAEHFLLLVEEEAKKTWNVSNTELTLAGWWREPVRTRNGNLRPTSRKLDSATSLSECGHSFFPHHLQEWAQPGWHLELGFVGLSAENRAEPPDFWSTELQASKWVWFLAVNFFHGNIKFQTEGWQRGVWCFDHLYMLLNYFFII